jgi:hypothetical protein
VEVVADVPAVVARVGAVQPAAVEGAQVVVAAGPAVVRQLERLAGRPKGAVVQRELILPPDARTPEPISYCATWLPARNSPFPR